MQIIDADSVNLWAKTMEELELEIECLMYPPSFHITAICKQGNTPSCVKVHFRTSEDADDDFIMTLPLLCNLVPYPSGMC